MPMPCYMTVEGESQGKIEGSCDHKGHEKSILAYAVDHKITMPTDPHSGLSSGKRLHEPLVLTKEFDKSSPKLYQALCKGEHLKNVEIKYFRVDEKGKQQHYFTQQLKDAIVVSMEPFVPHALDKENQHIRHMEKVGFTYGNIKWKWEPDGIETEDDWKGE